ncbi:MAG: hypothetical protein GXO04_05280, partial [Aquificae bacterium]|nr:hypothetical protein [Aquificota bacterium]
MIRRIITVTLFYFLLCFTPSLAEVFLKVRSPQGGALLYRLLEKGLKDCKREKDSVVCGPYTEREAEKLARALAKEG